MPTEPHWTLPSRWTCLRNQFGLWKENVDLLNDCRKLSGITFMNADDAIAFIIEKLWKRLKKTHKLRVVK